MRRFRCGYLNRELNTKCLEMDAELTVADFSWCHGVEGVVSKETLEDSVRRSAEIEFQLAVQNLFQDEERARLFKAEMRKPRERRRRACSIALGFENEVKEKCI